MLLFLEFMYCFAHIVVDGTVKKFAYIIAFRPVAQVYVLNIPIQLENSVSSVGRASARRSRQQFSIQKIELS